MLFRKSSVNYKITRIAVRSATNNEFTIRKSKIEVYIILKLLHIPYGILIKNLP